MEQKLNLLMNLKQIYPSGDHSVKLYDGMEMTNLLFHMLICFSHHLQFYSRIYILNVVH